MAEPDKRPAWAWSGRFTHSVYSICFSIAISAALVLLISRSCGHDVGEPKLEETQIWQTCCLERDCRPQQVAIVIKNHNRKQILVNIEGVETAVDKEVFKPVPSNRTGCVISTQTDRYVMKIFGVSFIPSKAAPYRMATFSNNCPQLRNTGSGFGVSK